jgi:predicted ABC-type exoprotein transport system permease subunit
MGRIHKIKTMVIAIFISLELVAILVAVGLALWFPIFVEKIGDLFTQGWQMYCVLVGLPLGGLVLGYRTLNSLLHPKDAEQKGFYKWPDYPLLRYYGYVPIFLCIIGAATAFVFLIAPQLLSMLLIGTIYMAVTLAWAVSIITLGMAKLRIGALLGGAD